MLTPKNTESSETSDANTRLSTGRSRLRWLAVPVILGALSLLTAGYLSTFTSAKLIDGDRVINLQTHQTTVGAALKEAAIEMMPEDVISPLPGEPLNRNDTIIIRRARLVRVNVDEQNEKVVRTQAHTAEELLGSLGIAIGDRDRLTVNGQSTSELPVLAVPTSPKSSLLTGQAREAVTADITLKHAVEVTIQEQNGSPKNLLTTAPTVGEALMQAGYRIYLADIVRPSPGEPIKAGTHIFVSRSHPVNILVDGHRVKTRTTRTVIGDVLADLNLVLYGDDYAKPGLDAVVTDDMEIRVVRVRHEVVINQEVIPFETRTEPSGEVELDTVVLAQPGQPGVHEQRTAITFEDNVEVGRQLIADFIAQDPQPRVYNYGTQVVLRSLSTPSGVVQYWRVIHMLATSYSANTAGTSLGASYYGKVRCGDTMRHGIVAVDPRIISLRTNVYVPDYGMGYACDTGSAIVGKRIDLGYDDSNLKSWYNWVDVYLLTPVPDVIRYNIK